MSLEFSGETEWKTSLWPREGRYIVSFKDSVKAEGLEKGDTVTVRLEVGQTARRKSHD